MELDFVGRRSKQITKEVSQILFGIHNDDVLEMFNIHNYLAEQMRMSLSASLALSHALSLGFISISKHSGVYSHINSVNESSKILQTSYETPLLPRGYNIKRKLYDLQDRVLWTYATDFPSTDILWISIDKVNETGAYSSIAKSQEDEQTQYLQLLVSEAIEGIG